MADRIEPVAPGAAKSSAPPPYSPTASQVRHTPAHSVVEISPRPAASSISSSRAASAQKNKKNYSPRSIWNLIARPPTSSAVSRKFALADAYLRVVAVVLLLSITAVVYAVSVRLSRRHPPIPPQLSQHQDVNDNGFEADARRAAASANGVPPILHCAFASILLILVLILWRCIRIVVRVHAYHPRSKQQTTFANENDPALRQLSLTPRYSLSSPSPLRNVIGNTDDDGEENSNNSSFRHQLFTAFFGPPPPKPAPPRLPSYTSALRSAARLSAIRYEEVSNVRRGRDDNFLNRERVVGATGDSEDIEIERVRRMGGGPPAYQTPEMLASRVILETPRSPSNPPSPTSTSSSVPGEASSSRRSRITEFRLSSWLPSSFLRRLSFQRLSAPRFSTSSSSNNNNNTTTINHTDETPPLSSSSLKEKEEDMLTNMQHSRHSFHVSTDPASRRHFKRRSVGVDEKRFSLPL